MLAGSGPSDTQWTMSSQFPRLCTSDDHRPDHRPDPRPDHELPDPDAPRPSGERRRHKRFGVERPGKVFRRTSQRYEPAATLDLSFGGARLRVESERGFEVGEIVDVGVALKDRPLLRSPALVRGLVVRARTLAPGRQEIALRYLHREGVEQAA